MEENNKNLRFRETYDLDYEALTNKDSYGVSLIRSWFEDGKPLQMEYAVVEWRPISERQNDPNNGFAFEIPDGAEFSICREVRINRGEK